MSNTILTNAIIAKEALVQLENQMVLGNLVHRGYEDEFDKNTNGYKVGESISIRRPNRYTLRTGATMAVQDSVEGKVTLTVDQQMGVDLGGWSSKDRTLNISDFSERFIQPAMKTIAQGVDAAVAANYKSVWNWVGTPGNTVDSYADFAKGPQRLDEMAVPGGDRNAILSPADHWGMVGSVSGLYISDKASSALTKAKLPMLGGVDAYMTQNTPSHVTGSRDDTTPIVNGNINTTYDAVKNSYVMDLPYTGADASATFKAGDVIQIADCYAVNPVSKARQSYLQQFVVQANVTSSGGAGTLSVSPPIITSGAYQTVDIEGGTTASKAITNVGTGSTSYRQNMVFHKNAFALVVVPMVKPDGAVDVQRVTHKGLSVRMIPVYTGGNDTSAIRLDILLGTKAIYPDLATRLSGS
jgi:hypothetical protein